MEEIIFLSLLTFFASFIGTLTGFGNSTIMVPVLLMFLPFAPTMLLTGILHIFNDAWKIIFFRKGIRWKLVLYFGIPAMIATSLGSVFIFTAPEGLLSRIMGAFLLAYSLFLLFHHKFKMPADAITAVTGGLLSGFFSGIFGLGGAIRSAFLAGFRLPPAVFLSTIGLIGLLTDLVRVGTYTLGGVQLDSYIWAGMLLFVPASFLGAVIAKLFVDKINAKQYNAMVAVFLLLAGLQLFISN